MDHGVCSVCEGSIKLKKKIVLSDDWEKVRIELLRDGFPDVVEYVDELLRKIERLRSAIAVLRIEE